MTLGRVLLAVAVLAAVFAAGADRALADEACLADVKALRAELADDARLLSKARGDLDRAAKLCRLDRAEEARALLQTIRDQLGLSMGQGR